MVTNGGEPLVQVARDLDIRPDMLRRWKAKLTEDPEQAFPDLGRLKERDEEMRKLRRENEKLRAQREILKKALAIFSEPRR